nr:hypothetical protein [Tanacetum cinerariifolium]
MILQPDPVIPVPKSSKTEYDQLAKAQQVSVVVAVSVKEAEEKNVAIVEKGIMAEEIYKMVEEPETHKESPMEKGSETPPRSPRTNLSWDKEKTVELTKNDVHMTDVPSQSKSKCAKHLRGVVERVARHINRIFTNFKNSFVQRSEVDGLCDKITDTFNNKIIPKVAQGTRQVVKANLRKVMNMEMKQEVTSVKNELSS